MEDIKTNLNDILNKIPQGTRLVAVSKFHPADAIMLAYETGHRIFGESRVQELNEKYEKLPKDIEWHFIGHLQTNKVKYIVPYISMIHAVDSFKLLEEINRQASKADRVIPCLLEVHIAKEESKYGFSFDECRKMLNEASWKDLKNVSINGIMGMATFTDNQEEIKQEFHRLHSFFDEMKKKHFEENDEFRELSMGMSEDYTIAIEEGSTLIRVGSKIFGNRSY